MAYLRLLNQKKAPICLVHRIGAKTHNMAKVNKAREKPRYNYVLTNRENKQYYYGSLEGMCEHTENNLNATPDGIYNERRRNGGAYPVEVDGCIIDKVRVWSVNEIRANNPATI